MSIASLLSIKVTSPITHMVSSAVRGVAASVLGVWLFQDIVSTYVPAAIPCTDSRSAYLFLFHSGRATSIAAILLGSIFYTWVKHQESQPKYERVPLEKIEEGKGDMSPTKRSRTPSD